MNINKSSRYSVGEVLVEHRDKVVNTTVGSTSYDYLVENIETLFNYRTGYIPAGFEHRPDLISDLFYGTVGYWWLLMLVNGVSDPNEGFNVNDLILIPEL